MEQTTNESTAETFDETSFEELARSNPRKWVTKFTEGTDISQRDLARDDYDQAKAILLGMTVKLVHDEGGYEGGGEYAECVFAIVSSLEEYIAYFRFTGCYCSYEGTEWDDDFDIVEPREVTNIAYFAI